MAGRSICNIVVLSLAFSFGFRGRKRASCVVRLRVGGRNIPWRRVEKVVIVGVVSLVVEIHWVGWKGILRGFRIRVSSRSKEFSEESLLPILGRREAFGFGFDIKVRFNSFRVCSELAFCAKALCLFGNGRQWGPAQMRRNEHPPSLLRAGRSRAVCI